jgi:iron complex transport system ATP-binding protein
MQLLATGVSAGYGEVDVLHEVNVEVNSGEFVGLVGPNGCGKSTLLRVLSKTLLSKHGSIVLDGVSIGKMSAIEMALAIAFVPQQEPAIFDFTVHDVVLMGRYPHHNRKKGDTEHDYEIVREALAAADICELIQRPITRLSGGEHRRVLLARALAQDAPLMLLDEPTAHLDVTHQAELLTLVQKLVKKKSVGALAALHELNHAAEYCDRLVLMCNGRVIHQGVPAEVLTPENLSTAYGARARVGKNPVTGRPIILSVTSLRDAPNSSVPHPVHLICGGGSGTHILHTLVRNGYPVTAGVLNENDNDWETALALGVEMVVEAPFSAISGPARAEARTMMAACESVAIADVPFGAGNLANLEIASELQALGKRIVLLDSGDMAHRDYTGGAATEIMTELVACGAKRYNSVEEWIAAR